MKKKRYRKAIFAVVYYIINDKIKYAILKRKKHWKGWEFTKGKIEKGETKKKAVRREVEEETGLRILKIKRFKQKGEYKYKKELKDRPGTIGQTYKLFAVEVEPNKIKVDPREHFKGEWVSFKQAEKKLTWPNQRKCLKIVNSYLKDEI